MLLTTRAGHATPHKNCSCRWSAARSAHEDWSGTFLSPWSAVAHLPGSMAAACVPGQDAALLRAGQHAAGSRPRGVGAASGQRPQAGIRLGQGGHREVGRFAGPRLPPLCHTAGQAGWPVMLVCRSKLAAELTMWQAEGDSVPTAARWAATWPVLSPARHSPLTTCTGEWRAQQFQSRQLRVEIGAALWVCTVRRCVWWVRRSCSYHTGVTMRHQAAPARRVQATAEDHAMQLPVVSSIVGLRPRARAARNSVRCRRAVPSQASGVRLPAQQVCNPMTPSTTGCQPKRPPPQFYAAVPRGAQQLVGGPQVQARHRIAVPCKLPQLTPRAWGIGIHAAVIGACQQHCRGLPLLCIRGHKGCQRGQRDLPQLQGAHLQSQHTRAVGHMVPSHMMQMPRAPRAWPNMLGQERSTQSSPRPCDADAQSRSRAWPDMLGQAYMHSGQQRGAAKAH